MSRISSSIESSSRSRARACSSCSKDAASVFACVYCPRFSSRRMDACRVFSERSESACSSFPHSHSKSSVNLASAAAFIFFSDRSCCRSLISSERFSSAEGSPASRSAPAPSSCSGRLQCRTSASIALCASRICVFFPETCMERILTIRSKISVPKSFRKISRFLSDEARSNSINSPCAIIAT